MNSALRSFLESHDYRFYSNGSNGFTVEIPWVHCTTKERGIEKVNVSTIQEARDALGY